MATNDDSRARPRFNTTTETELDESNFIRAKLFEPGKSPFSRYTGLVLGSFSWLKFIKYELLVTFVGPIPGALGLLLRKYLYPGLFHKAGKGTIFGPNLTLHHADRITLGDNVVFDRGCLVDARGAGDRGISIGNGVIINRNAAVQAKVGHIEIGDECNIGADTQIISQGPITLGRSVSLAGKAIVAGGRYIVATDPESQGDKRRFTSGSISIGKYTRVGMGAIIQDGVKIGERAIVAPGSVVFEDVASNQVVWGNPARPLRSRSRDEAGKTQNSNRTALPDGIRTELVEEVCAFLESDLFIKFGPGEFSLTDSLIDANVMDSLGLVRLLMWIEKTYDIDLDFSDLDSQDLDSVEKIVARVNEVAR